MNNKIQNCCEIKNNKTKKCIRKQDGKIFNLPRRFTKKQCINPRGFSMRSSCSPYKFCKQFGGTKKRKLREKRNRFLFNPNNPEKSFDVYVDKNPNDTIPIKYTTYEDVVHTIQKLENLYKQGKYSHKRIWQVGMILMVRLRVLKSKKPKQFRLANKYFKFLGKRTKIKSEKERKKMIFTHSDI